MYSDDQIPEQSEEIWQNCRQLLTEIIRDEIFGAIAALTATVRNANVIATSDCLVMVVPSDRFQSLLASRPEMVTKLIEDMARNIVSSNEQIVNLSCIK